MKAKRKPRSNRVASDDGLADIDDTKRLNWMIENSAWVGWTREGEHCRVWINDDDDSDPEPVCGWHLFFEDSREAIDAAMSANAPLNRRERSESPS